MINIRYNSSYTPFISIGIFCALLWLLGDRTIEALKYDQSAILAGEYWRIITGHLVHTNLWHLLLNLASLTMIAVLFAKHLSATIWYLSFMASALFISGCYYFYAVEYQYYLGLSAVLYGVIIIGAIFDIKHQAWVAWLILIIVTGRVIWQQFSGTVDELAAIIDDRVAIESHLFGIISGYLITLLLVIFKQFKQVKRSTDNTSVDT